MAEKREHRHFRRARRILDELERKTGRKPVRLEERAEYGLAACANSYLRLIYIGDETLDTLDYTEIVVRAVLAHELGHINLKHFYWSSLVGLCLFYGIIPAGILIWLVTGSWLAGLVIPPATYFCYGLVVQMQSAATLMHHDADPHERAAHHYGAALAGEDLYARYREAMKSPADYKALLSGITAEQVSQ
jgi:hypothetical protein